MPKRSLKSQLEALRRELAAADALDGDTRALLMEVADEIDDALAARKPDYDSLRGRIAAVALKFEADHPRFAGILGEIMDTLAKLGI